LSDFIFSVCVGAGFMPALLGQNADGTRAGIKPAPTNAVRGQTRCAGKRGARANAVRGQIILAIAEGGFFWYDGGIAKIILGKF